MWKSYCILGTTARRTKLDAPSLLTRTRPSKLQWLGEHLATCLDGCRCLALFAGVLCLKQIVSGSSAGVWSLAADEWHSELAGLLAVERESHGHISQWIDTNVDPASFSKSWFSISLALASPFIIGMPVIELPRAAAKWEGNVHVRCLSAVYRVWSTYKQALSAIPIGPSPKGLLFQKPPGQSRAERKNMYGAPGPSRPRSKKQSSGRAAARPVASQP